MVSWGQKHFQVSGLGHRVPGPGIQVRVQVQVQESGTLSSVIDAVIYAVIYSALHAVLYSVLNSSCPQVLETNLPHALA
jgi:hypothetical protein